MTIEGPKAANGLPPVLDNVFGPEVFASTAAFFAIGDGVVTITLASLRFDNSTTPAERKLVVVGRLVMPISGAQGLALGLHDFLEQKGINAVSQAEKDRMQ